MCCCLSYKDTILKANHSPIVHDLIACVAVAYPTKILFWKRITALMAKARTMSVLLLILQRYYFESESQHMRQWNTINQGCCLSYKDTILKANHSSTSRSISKDNAVAYPTKILFWKRITAPGMTISICTSLLLILQRYYFESESQHILLGWSLLIAVAYPTKILFWKRITARVKRYFFLMMLLLILQRYYFESESQRYTLTDSLSFSCCLSYKDTILKANHS